MRNPLICCLVVLLLVVLMQEDAVSEPRIVFPKTDSWLMRTDTTGHELWSREFDTGQHAEFTVAKLTCDSGLVLLQGADTCDGTAAVRLIMTDMGGNIQWERCYHPVTDGHAGVATDIMQLRDGRFVLAGSFGWERSAWLMCLDRNGEGIWSRSYAISNVPAHVACSAIALLADGGFVLCGTASDSVAMRTADNRTSSWIIKVDSTGLRQWMHVYDHGDMSDLCSIAASSAGNISAVGFHAYREAHSNHIRMDSWRVIVDQLGSVIQDKPSHESNQSLARSVRLTPDDNFIYEGYAGDDVVLSRGAFPQEFLLEKTDTYGKVLWTQRYQGRMVSRMCPSQDNGYLLFGNELPGDDSTRYHFVKIDQLGAIQWSRESSVLHGGEPTLGGPCSGGYFFAGDHVTFSRSRRSCVPYASPTATEQDNTSK